jgi:hypothetical protein
MGRDGDCCLIPILAVCLMAIAPLALAANSSESRADGCLRPAIHAPVEWQPSLATGLHSARIYFRAANARNEHYVEMRRDLNGRFWAVLPKANNDAEFVNYRIVTFDEKGQGTTREQRRITVTENCAAPHLTPGEAKMSDRLLIGTDVDAPSVPVGFRCDGIIGSVSASGVLRPYDACEEQTLAMAGIRRQRNGKGGNQPEQAVAEGASASGVIIPLHHRTPRRAPIPPTPPQPRLREPVSRSRP